MKNKHGFTLFELLAVIMILGMLAVLVSTLVINNKERAANRAYDVLLKTIETSAELYVTDHAYEYANIDTPGAIINIKLQDLVSDGYIDSPIINPRTGEAIPNLDDVIITITVISAGVINISFTIE